MPKLLIASSHAHKKDRKAATSIVNMKKLIEKRVEKDGEDKVYTLITLNTKMKLANVVALINGSIKSLTQHEGVISVEQLEIDPTKKKGRWTQETVKSEPTGEQEAAKPKKKKKKA
jgi:hypothetical protein